MPEQQKVDETVESTSKTAYKKMPKKIEKSSISLENDENSTIDAETANNADSLLESETDDT